MPEEVQDVSEDNLPPMCVQPNNTKNKDDNKSKIRNGLPEMNAGGRDGNTQVRLKVRHSV